MSWKSVRFSFYSLILFIGVLVGIIFLFKTHFLMVLIGVVALIFPAMLQRKALHEASGTFDTILAKYVVPILAVVATLFVILALAVWIK